MKYSNVKVNSIRKDKKAARKTGVAVIVIVFASIITGFFLFKNKDHAAFNPISIVASVTASELKQTDGRTNVLILGSDKRSGGVVTSVLTDTIIVASIGQVDKDVVLMSIPRDLWVQDAAGRQMKINSVYTLDSINYSTGEADYNKGTQELTKIVENVLGMPIHYYVVINFEMFEKVIDLLGGINVNVDKAFTDYEYPVEGKEADLCGKTQEEIDKKLAAGEYLPNIVPCRYQTMSFAQGMQVMDSVKALAYARSRHGNNDEGTDFARAHRQQKVIMAVKDKALSLQTIVNPQKLKDLYDLYAKNVETNIDLTTAQNFYLLTQQINFDKVSSLVLDDRSEAETGGLLYSPQDRTLYNGAYVLIPQTGDYSQIHAYVQKYLFGEK